MNELVFKYGEEAKKSGESLKEHVLDKGNNKEQELVALLGTNVTNIDYLPTTYFFSCEAT